VPAAGSRGRIGVVLALFVVIAILIVAGVAVLVVRDRPLIADDPVGSRALAWSTEDGVSPQDLAGVRFAVALRGYRMDEVDRVLDDTREALAGRDARIADLQRVVAGLGGAPGVSQEPSREPSREPSVPASAVEDGS
jgi:DivIVA domain-containing protein